jgi:hypothetical protein
MSIRWCGKCHLSIDDLELLIWVAFHPVKQARQFESQAGSHLNNKLNIPLIRVMVDFAGWVVCSGISWGENENFEAVKTLMTLHQLVHFLLLIKLYYWYVSGCMVIAPITADQNHFVDNVSYDYEFQNMKACSKCTLDNACQVWPWYHERGSWVLSWVSLGYDFHSLLFCWFWFGWY